MTLADKAIDELEITKSHLVRFHKDGKLEYVELAKHHLAVAVRHVAAIDGRNK